MDKKIAEQLIPVVNDALDLKALQEYADWRISVYVRELEQATAIEHIWRIQGAIKELRRFQYIKKEVLGDRD